MKKVLVYSTCQGLMIREHLYNCPEFMAEYDYVEVVQNYQLIWGKQNFLDDPIRADYLKNCDVFIHQPLNDSYGSNATSALLPYLKPTAKQITIPYIWNTAFWPLVESQIVDTTDNFHVVSKSIIKNKGVITSLVDRGLSYDNIRSLYLEGKIDFKYQHRWDKVITVLQLKEKNTDIKVVDFILDNYKKTKLFANTSHPTSVLIKYMTEQILSILGFENFSFSNELEVEKNFTQMPYDQSATDFFKFEFANEIDGQKVLDLINQIVEEYKNA